MAGRRVVIVLPTLVLGGAERQGLGLARQLSTRAYARVEVWSIGGASGTVSELCERAGIPWRKFPLTLHDSWFGFRREWIEQLGKLAWALRWARPYALLPYCMGPNVACSLVWRLTGAKVCVWNQRDAGIPVCPDLEPLAAGCASHVVSNSSAGGRFLSERLGVDERSIRFVNNGVDLATPQDDRRTWRERLGLAHDVFTACMIANLHSKKDHATLIRAWRVVIDRLAPAGLSPVLLLAGHFYGTEKPLKALCAELGLHDSVRFLGPVRDIAGLLGSVDLGVHSSLSEGSPNGVLESMAAGLPVVGTDIPGIQDALGPNGLRFLSGPGDAESMAARIVAFAENPAMRSAAGTMNQQRVAAEFSPGRMYERMLDVMAQPFPRRSWHRAMLKMLFQHLDVSP